VTWHKDFEKGGEKLSVQAARDGDEVRVQLGADALRAKVLSVTDGVVRFALDGQTHEARAVRVDGEIHVRLDGRTWRLPLRQGRRAGAGAAGDGKVVAPMTGTVLEIRVQAGDVVTADQTVAVLTAMKMEHKLVAGVDGVVAEVGAAAGDTVDQGALLVAVEAGSPSEA